MRKVKVFFVIIGLVLALAGGGILAVSIVKANSNDQQVVNTHVVKEAFDTIETNVTYADIDVKPAKDDKCTVECKETDSVIHTVKVSDKKLKITNNDSRKWYDKYLLNFNYLKMKITIYLPTKELESINLNVTTGDIKINEGFSVKSINVNKTTGDIEIVKATVDGDIKIKTTTGDIQIFDTTSKSLDIEGSTSDVTLTRFVTTGAIKIATSTGDTKFDMSDGASISVSTTTGDVEGTLLTPKSFTTTTSVGDVSVPQGTTGGPCVITTTTGDIKITIKSN